MKRVFLAWIVGLFASVSSSLAEEPQQGRRSPPEAGSAAEELLRGVDVRLLRAAEERPQAPKPLPEAGSAAADLGADVAHPPTIPMAAEAVPASPFWASAEYLLWWIKSNPLPPLMVQGQPGLLGAPGVNVVLGGNELSGNERSGGRFRAGYYLDDDRTLAVEGSYFFLAQSSSTQSVFSNGQSPADILFIPIINPVTGATSSIQVYAPIPGGFGFGRVSVDTFLQGAEANAVAKKLVNSGGLHLGLLGGFRYFQLHEKLTYDELNGATLPAQLFGTADQFETNNQFYGGQLGVQLEWAKGRWFALASGKIAVGGMQKEIDVFGTTTGVGQTGLGFNGTVPGGTFAQGTNFGHRTGSSYAILEEVTLNAGLHVRRDIVVFAGYNFLHVDRILRPGDQIDTQVNLTQYPGNGGMTGVVTGPARPAAMFNKSDFWAQGINFGLEFRF